MSDTKKKTIPSKQYPPTDRKERGPIEKRGGWPGDYSHEKGCPPPSEGRRSPKNAREANTNRMDELGDRGRKKSD